MRTALLLEIVALAMGRLKCMVQEMDVREGENSQGWFAWRIGNLNILAFLGACVDT